MMSVAKMMAEAWARSGLPVRVLAAQIIKHDGKPISPSYITDIEKGRAIPRDYIARQFAKVLRIPVIALLEACEKDRVAMFNGADH